MARPDGREQHEGRRLRLRRSAVGCAHGSAMLRLGNSAAVAGIRAEVTEVPPEAVAGQAQGHIAVAAEFSPLCSPSFREKHRTQSFCVVIAGTLSDILNNREVFDPAQLHIRKGELHWVLHLTVICLNYDGNAFDLCLLAALAALTNTQLPTLLDVSMPDAPRPLREVPDGTAGAVFPGCRIALLSLPMPASFVQLSRDFWVLDPSAAEEAQGRATVSLCLISDRWVVSHHGAGDASADQFLSYLMPAARARAPELACLFDGSDSETNPIGGLAAPKVAGAG
eukprot:NODE_13585_length_1158_cov_1.906887.p1 GENE.NODE_13585_length_1158_cov_1.906887~~NODE_13585_length_1158_cov_1.906887.p1  ORF type:complete len:326 (+),score=110.09 NODE_13585_length_1158_cov_1.906887:135-980(+)